MKFNLESECSKCGGTHASVSYHVLREPKLFCDTGNAYQTAEQPILDFLLRTCLRCGYTWEEDCLNPLKIELDESGLFRAETVRRFTEAAEKKT